MNIKLEFSGRKRSQERRNAKLIEASLASYSVQWLDTAKFYAQTGKYGCIADILDAQSDDWWVDLGCGMGHLMAEVFDRDANPTAIGIDSNPYALETAERLFNSVQIETNLSEEAIVHFTGRPPGYSISHSTNPDFSIREGVCNFLLDDILSLEYLADRLDGRQVDKVTFVSPGISLPQCIQIAKAFNFQVHSEDMVSLIHEAAASLRKSAIYQATQLLKPEGRFVWVERMHHRSGSIAHSPLLSGNLEVDVNNSVWFDIDNYVGIDHSCEGEKVPDRMRVEIVSFVYKQ